MMGALVSKEHLAKVRKFLEFFLRTAGPLSFSQFPFFSLPFSCGIFCCVAGVVPQVKSYVELAQQEGCNIRCGQEELVLPDKNKNVR